MKKFYILFFFIFVTPLLNAITLSSLQQKSYFDLIRGNFKNITVDENGVLSISSSFIKVKDINETLVWTASQNKEGTIFFGTGNDGIIYRLSEGRTNAEKFFDSGGPVITSLVCDDSDNLYAAVSPRGIIFCIKPDGTSSVFQRLPSRSIWAMTFDNQKRLIVAAGDPGTVYRISPDGKKYTNILQREENHFISLQLDNWGNIFAAGSSTGLVYKLEKDGKLKILFDSKEEELTTMLIDDNTLWVATTTEPNERLSKMIQSKEDEQQSSRSLPSRGILYKIYSNGVYEKIIDLPDQLFIALAKDKRGNLFVGSATTGEIWTVYKENGEEKVSRVGSIPSSQILSFLSDRKGQIWITTGNLGSVYLAESFFNDKGIYTSEVFDLKYPNKPGRILWEEDLPEGTSIKVETRSGNTEIPDDTWSQWYEPDTSFLMRHPEARFIQYRFTLNTSNKKVSPKIWNIRLNWSLINMKPEILRFEKDSSGEDTRQSSKMEQGKWKFIWECKDPNEDELLYKISCSFKDTEQWIDIAETRETSLVVDTRKLPDGWYTFKLTVSDRPSNSETEYLERSTEITSLLVDNTAPVFKDIKTSVKNDLFILEGTVEDEFSEIKIVEYSFNFSEWFVAESEDGVFDLKTEKFKITLKSKPSFIILRTKDIQNNIRMFNLKF